VQSYPGQRVDEFCPSPGLDGQSNLKKIAQQINRAAS
jgi:hypothetical protein